MRQHLIPVTDGKERRYLRLEAQNDFEAEDRAEKWCKRHPRWRLLMFASD
jgi:hypothetical protein